MAVSRTIDKASRIGTPELMRVPSVRMVRATIVFSTIMPMTGSLSFILSRMYAPDRLSLISFRLTTMAIGMIGITYQYFTNQREAEMRTSVMYGSFILNSRKIFSNFG